MENQNRFVAIGVPCYKAHPTIKNLLASVQMQSMRDICTVILANDWPEDNGSYEKYKDMYPELDIVTVDCVKNVGPGMARQVAFDKAVELGKSWITYMDADDVLFNMVSIENLVNNITPNCVMVQGTFLQQVEQGNLNASQKMQIVQSGGQIPPRFLPRSQVSHPWTFGRLINIQYFLQSGIRFSQLRMMEDGEYFWRLRLLIEGTNLMINRIDDPVYIWKSGSEHSITRAGVQENGGIPVYNFSACQIGATAAAINSIRFARKKNPFAGGVIRFAVQQMVGQYFTYIECLARKPIFAQQNLWNAKRFYHQIYAQMQKNIDDEILSTVYTMQYAGKAQDLIGVIPPLTFWQFMDKIRTDEFGGKQQFLQIRSRLPEWVQRIEKSTGVLGHQASDLYIPCQGEE